MPELEVAFDAIVAPSRTTVIVQALRRAILSGALPAGRPLVEAELARKFGTSKTPVREALKALVGIGLVTISDYKGAIVRIVDEEMSRNVFDVRCLLEPAAVMRTVEKGFDVAAARRALEIAASADDEGERSMANRDFHQLLYSGCGNPILVEMLDSLRDQTALISTNSWARTPSWDREAAEHDEILVSAESGDAKQTANLVFQHIQGFETKAATQMKAV